MPDAHARRRRNVLATVAGISLIAGVAAGAGAGSSAPETKPKKLIELPGGGRQIFPGRRIVALYGNPRDAALGELGIGTPAQAGRKLLRQARPYASRSRPVLPAMELIATVADAAPGDDGSYSTRTDAATIDRYLRAARRIDALLILDIQPGRAGWVDEIDRLAPWLVEPDVGLALDPEWAVGPTEIPGQVIGSMNAATINAAAAYLSSVVARMRLPEKLLLVHRFTPGGISENASLRRYSGVALAVNVDGFGTATQKIAKYKELTALNRDIAHGFKLFYEEDTRDGAVLMKPRQVRALQPKPSVVVYE